jgi:hypothetical protein
MTYGKPIIRVELMKNKKRWVVTGEDLKTFNKVHWVVGIIFTILILPIVLFVLLGAVSEKIQDWVSRKIVWNLSAYITSVINQMWRHKEVIK